MFFSTVQGLLPYSSSNSTVAVKKKTIFSFHVSVNCHTFCISWHADHARALWILMLLLAILIYEPKLLTSSTAFIILLLMLTIVSRFNVAINLLLTFRRKPTYSFTFQYCKHFFFLSSTWGRPFIKTGPIFYFFYCLCVMQAL